MKGALALRRVVATAYLDMSSTNITTSAWVQLVASLGFGASAVEIINNAANPLLIGVGGAGSEVAINYTVPPGGTPGLLPNEFSKATRISAKSIGATSNSGYLILNFLA